jgi:outer membrane immunogenic protein
MHQTLKLTFTTSLFALAFSTQSVNAADFGGTALRGSIQPQQQSSAQLWDGVYVGALGGYSSGTVGKTKGYSNIAPTLYGTEIDAFGGLQQALVSPSRAMSSSSIGGFVGYNSTWEDAVVGIEADYMRTNLKTNSHLDYGLLISGKGTPPTQYPIGATLDTASKITDIATLRGRVGYAMGNALPFLTMGVAFGHGQFSNKTVFVADKITGTAPTTVQTTIYGALNPLTGGYTNRDKFAAGLALGAGVDYAFTSAVFLRAEYQYIKFSSFGGGQVAINNARAGVAAKF